MSQRYDMIFSSLFTGCPGQVPSKDTGPTTEPDCSQEASAPFLGWGQELTLCLPPEADEEWSAHFLSESALKDSHLVLDGTVTNFIYSPVSTEPLASGDLIMTPSAWDLDDFTPELFGEATSLEDGMRNAQAEMLQNGSNVSEVASTTVDDLEVWYYMMMSTSSTTVLTVLDIDPTERRILDFSATVGGLNPMVTTDPNFWRSELVVYWEMLQGTVITDN